MHEGSARHQPGDRGRASSAKYQYDRLAVTRNQPRGQPGMKWGNVAQNRIDTIPYSQWQALASQSSAGAQQRVDQLKAQPSRAISMQTANKITGSQRGQERGASLASAKQQASNRVALGQQSQVSDTMSKVTGSSLIQKISTEKQQAQTTPVNTSEPQRITTAQARDPANQFTTSSGKVQVSRDGQAIARASDEGQVIQGLFDRQQRDDVANREQKKLYTAVSGASNWKEAWGIQEQARSLSPNIGTAQANLKRTKDGDYIVTEERGVFGSGSGDIPTLSYEGGKVSVISERSLIKDRKGNIVGQITGGGRDTGEGVFIPGVTGEAQQTVSNIPSFLSLIHI